MEDDKPDVPNEDIANSDSPAASASVESVPVAVDAASGSSPQITFRGNSYDLMSVVGVTVGGMTLLTCATCNMGFYCLPFVPIILGIIGLVAAKDSVDPERTKLLSWLSVGSGALILILLAAIFIAYFAFIFIIIAADSGSF